MKKFESQMDKKSADLVSMSNHIVKTRYKLSISTQKILLFLISNITYEERKDGKFLKEMTFLLSDIFALYDQTGFEKSNDLKDRLKNSIEELQKNHVSKSLINEKGEEYYKTYPWYSKIGFDTEKNEFVFKFNQEIASLLLNLKGYFESNLKEYLKLKSSYSIEPKADAFDKDDKKGLKKS